MILHKDVTSKLIRFRILDSSLTTGAGMTGLDNNLASINCYYIREGSASPVEIAVTSGTIGTYAEGTFQPVSNESMPGVYELSPPNQAFSAGSNSVVIYLDGVTNMKETAKEIQLVGMDFQDISAGGLKYLSNNDARMDTVLSTYLDATVSSRATAGDLSVTINTTE